MKLENKTSSQKFINSEFQTEIESWMVPHVNIIVIAHSEADGFIYDATKATIHREPSIKIKIDILPQKSKFSGFRPGQPMEIKLFLSETAENVSLHLLSVDERVRYLGNDNDITSAKFHKKLDEYYRKKELMEVSGKLDGQYDDLSDFNAFVITNTIMKEKDCKLLEKRAASSSDFNDSTLISKIGTKVTLEVSLDRTDFPETFIFEDICGSEVNENKAYTMKTTAPHAITNYLVDGFVFHPVHGLAIAIEKNSLSLKISSSKFPCQSHCALVKW